MLTYIVSALTVLAIACVVAGFLLRQPRQEKPEEYIPASWRDDRGNDRIDWLGDYPGRPAPSVDRMAYRPRHGTFIGIDAYWEPTRAYRIVTGRRRVAWNRIFEPVRVEFSHRFHRPPSRLGRWKILGTEGVR